MKEELSTIPIPTKYSVSLIDLGLLIYYAYVAAEHPEIGNNHAYATTEGLVKGQLNRSTLITRDALEAALYNANILDEHGLFWHPHFKDFKTLVASLLHTNTTGIYFDDFYNLIRRKVLDEKPNKKVARNK